jgi:hypothetical protein
MKTLLLDLICVGVVCVILTLGLWPFHSPDNEVSWLANRNGLAFGRFSTVISSAALQVTGQEGGAPGPAGTVEVWLQPRRIWGQGTILAIYNPGNLHQFSLRQSLSDLALETAIRENPHPANTARLYVPDAFRKPRPVFLTIASGIHGTAVYTNGVLARTAPHFQLAAEAFTGRLVLGDAPGQTDSWSGDLLGLAIYCRELTAAQALRHYETWTQRARPALSGEERNAALYLFDERAGNVVHDHAGSGVHLYIPSKYMVLEQIFLEPFWREFSLSRSYWDSALKNIIGFIPFGFCFCACLSAHKLRRAALATVILGTLVSLAIEILQAYLPTRDSGTTDIFTNTLGTCIGAVVWTVIRPFLGSRFPRLPYVASWGRRPDR